jgi:hypothetical protein
MILRFVLHENGHKNVIFGFELSNGWIFKPLAASCWLSNLDAHRRLHAGFVAFGQRDGEDTVVVGGLYGVDVHRIGQAETALEVEKTELAAQNFYLSIGLCFFAGRDGEDVFVDFHFEIAFFQTRRSQFDAEIGFTFQNIDGGRKAVSVPGIFRNGQS